jgi:hypothetical protein
VTAVRQHQQIEVLVRFDQLVHDQERVVRRNVRVHRAVREQQLSFQVLCHELIRLIVVVGRAVRIRAQQPLPLLGPVVLVDAIVVVAGL